MDIYWIWLSSLPYVGPVLQKKLICHFGNPRTVFEANKIELSELPGMNIRGLDSILGNRNLEKSERIANELQRKMIGIIRFCDDLYPEHARLCKESPILLYFRGNVKPIEETVAIVGSRRCSNYGKRTAEEIGWILAANQVPLISGFAKGIDSYAQASCVHNNGYTIGFLAGGVDICYPKEQHALYERILENNGAFISQYPPGSPPQPKHFLERNALISAWSKEVIVVEAGEKSGALWTANFAKKQEKRVLAVPHPIDALDGKGCNLLLAQGATPYLGIKSLQSIKLSAGAALPQKKATKKQNEILAHLSPSPLSISQLTKRLKVDEVALLEQLLTLELEGHIIIRGNMAAKT